MSEYYIKNTDLTYSLRTRGGVKLDFGTRLKMARGKMSQLDLAKELAISASTLGKYENNQGLPPADVFTSICEKLNISADSLLGINDVSSTPSNKGGLFNNRLANVREHLDLTTKDIADLVDVSVSTWTKYEKGSRKPPLKRIKKICEKCKVSADYLLGTKFNKREEKNVKLFK